MWLWCSEAQDLVGMGSESPALVLHGLACFQGILCSLEGGQGGLLRHPRGAGVLGGQWGAEEQSWPRSDLADFSVLPQSGIGHLLLWPCCFQAQSGQVCTAATASAFLSESQLLGSGLRKNTAAAVLGVQVVAGLGAEVAACMWLAYVVACAQDWRGLAPVHWKPRSSCCKAAQS